MSGDIPKPDIVDRAVEALLATQGPVEPPRDITEQIRRDIAKRRSAHSARFIAPSSLRSQVAWLRLAACVVLMVVGSEIIAFHESLFSREAGRQIFPDGTAFVQYTDGRVITAIIGDR